MIRLRRLTLTPLAASAVIFAVILAALTMGLRVSGLGMLGFFPHTKPFDYTSRPFGDFAPLNEQFITRAIGQDLDESAMQPSASARRMRERTQREPRVFDVHAPDNDDMRSPRQVPSVPFTARTDTRSADREDPAEPAECAPTGGTVWYEYPAPRDADLIADTVGSNYATILGVFERRSHGLVNIGCDADGWNAVVGFEAKVGRTYLFQIAGPAGGGRLVFDLVQRGVMRMVSVDGSGEKGDDSSVVPSVSDDGRWIAFSSFAKNIVPGTNGEPCIGRAPSPRLHKLYTRDFYGVRPCQQVYVRDRLTGVVRAASVSSSGEQPNAGAYNQDISADGRYVAFQSDATNLVAGDTNNLQDIFVHDLVTGRTERVSVSSTGAQATGVGSFVDGADSRYPSMSSDGRFVAFESGASNLVPGDTNRNPDVFVHDRLTRLTVRVSVSTSGEQIESGADFGVVLTVSSPSTKRRVHEDSLGDPRSAYGGPWLGPCISGSGHLVRFHSLASNLVANDENGFRDVFVHDLRSGGTDLVSRAISGGGANNDSGGELWKDCFSDDDRFVVFDSVASNLVEGDEDNIKDVFARDLTNGATRRASGIGVGQEVLDDAAGTQGIWSSGGIISGSGRYVVYVGEVCSPELPGCDGDRVYLHDLLTGYTELIDLPAVVDRFVTWLTTFPAISADGRVLAFEAHTLDPDPDHGRPVAPSGTDFQVWMYERFVGGA